MKRWAAISAGDSLSLRDKRKAQQCPSSKASHILSYSKRFAFPLNCFRRFLLHCCISYIALFSVATYNRTSRFQFATAPTTTRLSVFTMLYKSLTSLLLLPAAIRAAVVNGTSSSGACNNSPQLCSKRYNEVTYLGAHDSPFVRDASTDYSSSSNQYYNTTVQLSAGVRLLTAQVQLAGNNGNELHVCHSSCDLLDAGSLSDWLGEVRTWVEANPNDVVTVLLVNGATASASNLAAQYQAAGITTSLAYTPSGSTSGTQNWPTLQSLISSGTRLLNFVDSVDVDPSAPYLMQQYDYIFENNYDVTTPSSFSCEVNRPSNLQASQAISNNLMPLMNHFLYHVDAGDIFNIESPNASYVGTTNAPSGGLGNLGTAANTCKEYYGRAPSYVVVDFFNVGPAIATVDRLNGVTNPVGRTSVSKANTPPAASGSSFVVPNCWAVGSAMLAVFLAFSQL